MVSASYHGVGGRAGINEIILFILVIVSLIIGLYMLAKREAVNIAESVAKAASEAIPKIEIPNLFSSGEQTDLQTIDKIFVDNYNIRYADLNPEQQAEYQANLGVTKAYYEQYGTPMTWEAFQAAIGQPEPTPITAPPQYHWDGIS